MKDHFPSPTAVICIGMYGLSSNPRIPGLRTLHTAGAALHLRVVLYLDTSITAYQIPLQQQQISSSVSPFCRNFCRSCRPHSATARGHFTAGAASQQLQTE